MKAIHIALVCAGLALSAGPVAFAKSGQKSEFDGDPVAGQRYAVQVCAQCHDVKSRHDDVDAKASPPSFHAVANAKTTTAMGLNAFLLSPHTDMPNLIISRRDRRNVIAYILSLRDERQAAQAFVD